jgi:hypothetical protein
MAAGDSVATTGLPSLLAAKLLRYHLSSGRSMKLYSLKDKLRGRWGAGVPHQQTCHVST